jgi:hypothetical protein
VVDSMPQEINDEDFRQVVEYYVFLYAYIIYHIQTRLYPIRQITITDFMYLLLLKGYIANVDINILRDRVVIKQGTNLLKVDDRIHVD